MSPINPVPAGIMRPYDSFEGQSVLANQLSVLNDYVAILTKESYSAN